MNVSPRRLVSLDALRGCTVAAMLLVNDPGDWDHVYWPLEHARWNGCTPTDLVFPFFLFVVGMSVALAILLRREQGADRAALTRTALKRAVRIVGLGVLINVLAWWWMPGTHLRFPGVLQRIGVCYAGVALFALYTQPRTQWAAIATLLLGYWALLWSGGSLEPPYRHRGARPLRLPARPGERAWPRSGRPARHAAGTGHRLARSARGCWLRAGKLRPLLIDRRGWPAWGGASVSMRSPPTPAPS